MIFMGHFSKRTIGFQPPASSELTPRLLLGRAIKSDFARVKRKTAVHRQVPPGRGIGGARTNVVAVLDLDLGFASFQESIIVFALLVYGLHHVSGLIDARRVRSRLTHSSMTPKSNCSARAGPYVECLIRPGLFLRPMYMPSAWAASASQLSGVSFRLQRKLSNIREIVV